MPMRHSRRRERPDRVEVLAKRLPEELRSFTDWLYSEGGQPTGLKDYMAQLEDWIADELGKPPEVGAVLSLKVMQAAGLLPGDWYRHMLSEPS